MAELLRLEQINKFFGHQRILASVNMTVHAGECHALLGDVGSGKSTLINIIAGYSQPDEGAIYWQGKNIRAEATTDANDKIKSKNLLSWWKSKRSKKDSSRNLALLDNGPGLLPQANFIENMAILYGWGIHKDAQDIMLRVNSIMATNGFHFLTDIPIKELTSNEKLEANIVRCLFNNPRLLLIDNLSDKIINYGKTKFYHLVKQWQKQGMTIIYSTDLIDDALKIADDITLLKQGRRVMDFDPKKKNKKQIIDMLNDGKKEIREISHIDHKTNLLVVDNLSYEAEQGVSLSSINFSLRAGEVLGIVSLPDNGDDELFAALRGDIPLPAAMIKWHGKEPIANKDVVARRKKNIGFIPKHWQQKSILDNLDVFDNLLNLLVARPQGQKLGIINRNYVNSIADSIIKKYDLPIQNHQRLFKGLPESDKYKFVIGRELALMPEIFILHEPYVGVDKKMILLTHQVINDMVEKSAGVIVISSDVEEILSICDTVYVFANGLLSPPYEVKDQSKDFIESLMVGHAVQRAGKKSKMEKAA